MPSGMIFESLKARVAGSNFNLLRLPLGVSMMTCRRGGDGSYDLECRIEVGFVFLNLKPQATSFIAARNTGSDGVPIPERDGFFFPGEPT